MRTAIRQNIKSAFKQMADLKKKAKIKHLTGSEWDDATGKYVNTYDERPVEVYVTNFDKAVVDGLNITLNDVKVLLPAHQINFTPKIEDDFLIMDGKTYGLEMVQNKFDELFILKI